MGNNNILDLDRYNLEEIRESLDALYDLSRKNVINLKKRYKDGCLTQLETSLTDIGVKLMRKIDGEL